MNWLFNPRQKKKNLGLINQKIINCHRMELAIIADYIKKKKRKYRKTPGFY